MDAHTQELDGTAGATVDVAVIGGGLAGLAAAATAAAAGRPVLLLDGQQRGGRAATDVVGRYHFNRGAHALTTKGAGRTVLRTLGVTVKGSPPPLRGARGRLGDRIGLLPHGAVSLARTSLLTPREKLVAGRLLAGAGRWRPDAVAGLTAREWFDELGLTGTVRRLVEAITRVATYADLDVVSADVVAFQGQLVLDHGVEYLHGGWATLVDGLARAGERHGMRYAGGHRAVAVVPDGDRVRVELDGGGSVLARRAVLAPGSPAAARGLLPDGAAGWEATGPPAHTACLDLGVREVPPVPLLFGLDRPLYLSCHAPAAPGLAPAGTASVQLMWYLGAGDEPSPGEARAVLAEHAGLAGVDAAGAEEARYLHRMVAVSALPTPATGGLRGRPAVTDAGVDGVYLAGDWVGSTGYLADASLTSGAAAGRAAAESLDRAARTYSFSGPAA